MTSQEPQHKQRRKLSFPLKINLNLFQKALFLVSILLTFELVLLGSLAWLLSLAEKEAQESANSKAIAYQASALSLSYYKTGQSLFNFFATHDDSFLTEYRKSFAEIDRNWRTLVEICKPYPSDDVYLQRIGSPLKKLESTLTEAESAITHAGGLYSAQRLILVLKAQTMPVNREFMTAIVDLQSRHHDTEDQHPQVQAQLRNNIAMLIAAGAASNVLIAIILVRQFSARITRRLSVVSDNVEKLSRSETLNPKISGMDEVSSLDVVFHKMAMELKAAASKERAVVDNMPVGLATMDETMSITSVNPTLENLSGFPGAKLVGSSIMSLIPGLVPSSAQDIALGTVLEFRVKKFDGTDFPAQISISDFVGTEGRRYIVNIMDISDRYAIEQLKQEFVSIVSHDLRTPLTSILASLDLLSMGSLGQLNERGTKIVSTARMELNRLMSLIGDLLDMARMDAGRLELKMRAVALNTIIERSFAAVELIAAKKSVSISVPETNISIVADGDRLVQVLVNILGNAVKFSANDETVRLAVEDLGDKVRVSVSDNGPGVPLKFQSTIFERFGQVRQSDAREKGGAGLGLAIAKMIVESHHGTLGVDSVEGHGSRFWFEIPKEPNGGSNAS